MFSRFSNGWSLLQASARVLKADTELIVFPIISALGVLLVSAAFVVPVVMMRATHKVEQSPAGFALALAFYMVTYFVIFFCNAALVGAAMIRLRGGDPTVGDGVRIAASKAGSILGYALLAATVGMVLRTIQERVGLIGKIIVAIIGVAWSVATSLAVPVLVAEDVGPIEAVKRSTALLKQTWGEQIVGNGAIGTVFGLAIFLVLLVAMPAAFFVAQTVPAAAIAIGAVAALAVVVLAILNATLTSIYQAAVYLYAAEGKAQWFNADLLQNAYRRK